MTRLIFTLATEDGRELYASRTVSWKESFLRASGRYCSSGGIFIGKNSLRTGG
jgi:hypothetical protein